jgi:hypothetical protein
MNLDPQLEELAAELARGEMSLTTLADGSAVLLDLERRQVLSLNSSARFILDILLSEAEPDTASILSAFQQTYGLDASVAEQDLQAFVTDLYRFVFES